MSFGISLFGAASGSRAQEQRPPSPRVHDYDSSSSTDDANDSPRPPSRANPSVAVTDPSRHTEYLYPLPQSSRNSSRCSSASTTPVPSRSVSPLPQFYPLDHQSSCSSDTDEEPSSPLLRPTTQPPWGREERRKWWSIGLSSSRRRRRRRDESVLRTMKRIVRRIVRNPLVPKQPITIVLTLLLLTAFATLLTLLLIYILNPDKEPLPWRAYCSVPTTHTPPSSLLGSSSPSSAIPSTTGAMPVPFPPHDFDSLPPAGVFVGVFSVDSAVERRMLVRTTWASHPRSRNGAGEGDDGLGTSRTLVRFVLGQPRKSWEKRIQYEIEMYNDIIILPMAENMNYGKSHAFFTWAAENALVPPQAINATTPPFSYSNFTAAPPPKLAPHDPVQSWEEQSLGQELAPWVRPDYVVKVDDDSFVMLAELEARLRTELHPRTATLADELEHSHSSRDESSSNGTVASLHSTEAARTPSISLAPNVSATDPLVYWGYLVKNRFMGGELYALSWSLVDWVSKDPTVKTMTRGAEDKQTAKWMQIHPRAADIRWTSERCWIYDHPRSGTVYAHGFLFPSEVTRVRRGIVSYPDKTPEDVLSGTSNDASATLAPWVQAIGGNAPTPSAWAHSSVSTFGVRYQAPLSELTPWQSVQALVEGSDMSMLREGVPMTPEYAWLHREGRKKQYEDKRVGGTVVVHFIKKNMWYLETALAMLEGDEQSEFEATQLADEASQRSQMLSAIARGRQLHRQR
ncbi:glycosyltransferase family 31 protein [Plicaturopsis crispa FD-325 SS-3]|nr:glycosyltransferase family 31 protein [Plicaturopsis crispa FD-325 SS-3]